MRRSHKRFQAALDEGGYMHVEVPVVGAGTYTMKTVVKLIGGYDVEGPVVEYEVLAADAADGGAYATAERVMVRASFKPDTGAVHVLPTVGWRYARTASMREALAAVARYSPKAHAERLAKAAAEALAKQTLDAERAAAEAAYWDGPAHEHDHLRRRLEALAEPVKVPAMESVPEGHQATFYAVRFMQRAEDYACQVATAEAARMVLAREGHAHGATEVEPWPLPKCVLHMTDDLLSRHLDLHLRNPQRAEERVWLTAAKTLQWLAQG